MPAEQNRAGVGALLNPSMADFVARSLRRFDYLAVIPDRGWIDRGRDAAARFQALPQAAALLDRAARERPIVLHGIGLSICSAEIFDQAYAENLIDWARRLGSPWISDHLSFSRVGTGHEINAAIPLPVPYDHEVLDLLIPRVRFFTERLECPFLLENNVYYFRYPDQELSEEEFLNQLCRRSGCRVLLDLHNLYTNATNHGFSAADYLDRLDLANVVEIHVAGGVPMMGFQYRFPHRSGARGGVGAAGACRRGREKPARRHLRVPRVRPTDVSARAESSSKSIARRPSCTRAAQTRCPMSLRSFQQAIVDLTLAPVMAQSLRRGDAAALAGYDLTQRERDRILDIVSQAGISVHCSLSRGNRFEIIVNAFPMTCVLLQPTLRALVDELWLEHRPTNYQLSRRRNRVRHAGRPQAGAGRACDRVSGRDLRLRAGVPGARPAHADADGRG